MLLFWHLLDQHISLKIVLWKIPFISNIRCLNVIISFDTFTNIGQRYSSQQQNNYHLLQETVKIKQGKEQTTTTRGSSERKPISDTPSVCPSVWQANDDETRGSHSIFQAASSTSTFTLHITCYKQTHPLAIKKETYKLKHNNWTPYFNTSILIIPHISRL